MKYIPHAAVVILSAMALLWRIDGTVLWRDEASTACWARGMIERRSLIPRVFDGQRLVVQAANGHDFNDHFLPSMQGWLQFYVAALGFLVAGVGTVGARMPFVIAGAVSLWILYRIARELFGSSTAALAAPLLGATSIYFLTAARQARYYILVILLTSCILLEFCRYFRRPERARSPGFYLRLGIYGVLVYLANYVSFGGLWLSLIVFVLFTRDHALIRRFLLLSAALALLLAGQFLVVHSDFVTGSQAARLASWSDYQEAFRFHGEEMFRMIPLAALMPAAWYAFVRRRGPWTALETMAALSTTIVLVSVVSTVLVVPLAALPRYYFQILPALLLLTAILAERLRVLAGRFWAGLFLLFALAWPNLNFYHNWTEHAVERQLTKDTTCNEPIVDFLRRNVKPEENVAFYRNVQGIMAYFNLPWLRWTALLDSDDPRNQRRRGLLPDYVFDDYEGVDWYVVWDNRGKMPKKLTPDYRLVWEYAYANPKSWWDRHEPTRVLSYRVYRRVSPAPGGAGTRK
ncbi:MAG: glycosyltransferase family 39 protein [Acidobacteria bacterium]|nr:glycosyltransferase family 39 protein [Acidobacteriota bacterium]